MNFSYASSSANEPRYNLRFIVQDTFLLFFGDLL